MATPFGPVAASRLQPGDEVLGPGGQTNRVAEARPLALSAEAHRRLALGPPIEIAPGALGFGMPSQALVLGPGQCLRLDGAWLPAQLLADGRAIRPLDEGAKLVLLRCADAAPFLAAGTLLASEGTPPASDGASAPAGAISALLRLGGSFGTLAGYVDHADRYGIAGWVIDTTAPDRVVPVEAETGGTCLVTGLADRPRPDLARGQTGSRFGRHGFALSFPRPLPPGRPWLLTVRRAGGGPALPGTPLLIDAATASPARFDIALAGLPATPASVEFLAGLIERALQARQA